MQAVIYLDRRRINLLWAMLRENRTWQSEPTVKTTTRPGRLDSIIRDFFPSASGQQQEL